MSCKFRRRVDHKFESIPPEEMADVQFNGICVFEIVDFFVGTVKTLRLVPIEFLVREVKDDMSHFDDDDNYENKD